MLQSALWNPLQGKPRYQYRPRLNPAHPLNNGLLGYWLLNEGGGNKFYDLVGKNTFDDLTGCIIDPNGLLVATQQWATCNAPKIPAIGYGNYTVHIDAKIDTYGATGRGMLAFGTYDPAWAFNSVGKLYVYDGGAKTESSVAITAGIRSTFTFTRIGTDANQLLYYSNGRYSSTAQHADSIAAPATIEIGTDRDSNLGTEAAGTYYGVSIYNRALSQSDILLLHTYPYGTTSNPRLIVEPRYAPWVNAGGAPPPVTGYPQLMMMGMG